MSRHFHNPLFLLEASRRIELLYTDLQSAASPLRQLALGGVEHCYPIITGVASSTVLQFSCVKRCRLNSDVSHHQLSK